MSIILEAPEAATSVRKSLNTKRGLNSMRKNSMKESLPIIVKKMIATLGTDSKQLFQTHRVRFHNESPPKNSVRSVRQSLMDKIC